MKTKEGYEISLENCKNIVELPPNITKIIKLRCCDKIEVLDLTNCNEISDNAIFHCSNLKRIIGWGNHDMIVGNNNFEFCPNIDINIWNDRLKFIHPTRYIDPETLESIKSLGNPYLIEDLLRIHGSTNESILNIIYHLVYTSIKELTISGSLTSIPLFHNNTQLKTVKFETNLLTTIPSHCFQCCYQLENLILSESITTIESYAFDQTKISKIDLSHVTNINLSAFSNTKIKEYQIKDDSFYNIDIVLNMKELEKLRIGSTVSKVNFSIFGSGKIKSLIFENGNRNFHLKGECLLDENEIIMKYFINNNLQSKYEVPKYVRLIDSFSFSFIDNLNEIDVSENTFLTDYSFFNCQGLTTVNIKNKQIHHLPNHVFCNCTHLQHVIFPDNSQIKTLGLYCFGHCINIERLEFNSLNYVDEYCFYNCSKLIYVNLSKVQKINKFSFSYTSQNLDLHLSDTLTEISFYSFSNSRISSFTFPTNLKKIYDYAFSYCNNLETIVFNENLKMIGEGSFSFCEKLKSVTIPDSLTMIDPNSFYGSYNCKFVISSNSIFSFNETTKFFIEKSNGRSIFNLKKPSGYLEIPEEVKILQIKDNINNQNKNFNEKYYFSHPCLLIKETVREIYYYQNKGKYQLYHQCIDSDFQTYSENYYYQSTFSKKFNCKKLWKNNAAEPFSTSNVFTYEKSGDFELPYKVDNSIYGEYNPRYNDLGSMEPTFTLVPEFFNRKSLYFSEQSSTIQNVLICITCILFVCIIILSLIALKFTRH